MYRESIERRAVMCPTCQRPVEIDREDTATCTNCDARFATRGATTLVEYTATRHLVKALGDGPPAQRGMSARTRWVATGGVLGAIVAMSAAFGVTGFMIGFAAAFGLAAIVSARGGTYLR